MLVCHCKAVFERRVREAIAAGARDVFAIAAACGAGTGCGGCVPTVTRLLLQMLAQEQIDEEVVALKGVEPAEPM